MTTTTVSPRSGLAEDHLLLQDLFPAVAGPGPTLVVKSTIPAAEVTPPVNPACTMS